MYIFFSFYKNKKKIVMWTLNYEAHIEKSILTNEMDFD